MTPRNTTFISVVRYRNVLPNIWPVVNMVLRFMGLDRHLGLTRHGWYRFSLLHRRHCHRGGGCRVLYLGTSTTEIYTLSCHTFIMCILSIVISYEVYVFELGQPSLCPNGVLGVELRPGVVHAATNTFSAERFFVCVSVRQIWPIHQHAEY